MATENFTGYLRYNPEMQFTSTGLALVKFLLYDTPEEAFNTRENVICWAELAEACNTLLDLGDKVFIKGKHSERPYQDQEGNTKIYKQITAYKIFKLDGTTQEMSHAKEVKW